MSPELTLASAADIQRIEAKLNMLITLIAAKPQDAVKAPEMMKWLGCTTHTTMNKKLRAMRGFPEPIVQNPLAWERSSVETYFAKQRFN